jgi:hypothetical protein
MEFAVRNFALIGMLALLALAGSAGVLVVTGTASARSESGTDGALSVKNSDGRVVMIASKGVVIGRVGKGQITIKDPNPNDGPGPIVTGADSRESLGEKTTRYSGSNIRFRIIGGSYSLTVFGTNIDLSAVGRGMVTLDGTLSAKSNSATDDDTYAVNGTPPQPFPTFRFTFPLAAPPIVPSG